MSNEESERSTAEVTTVLYVKGRPKKCTLTSMDNGTRRSFFVVIKLKYFSFDILGREKQP
jgi:hypothetical protein